MVIAAMFLAFLFGAVGGAHPHREQAEEPERPHPFGPYLALGSILAVLYGAWLVDAYLGLLG